MLSRANDASFPGLPRRKRVAKRVDGGGVDKADPATRCACGRYRRRLMDYATGSLAGWIGWIGRRMTPAVDRRNVRRRGSMLT